MRLNNCCIKWHSGRRCLSRRIFRLLRRLESHSTGNLLAGLRCAVDPHSRTDQIAPVYDITLLTHHCEEAHIKGLSSWLKKRLFNDPAKRMKERLSTEDLTEGWNAGEMWCQVGTKVIWAATVRTDLAVDFVLTDGELDQLASIADTQSQAVLTGGCHTTALFEPDSQIVHLFCDQTFQGYSRSTMEPTSSLIVMS